MRELSLHILDIVQNSISAGATVIEICILENEKLDLLQLKIIDNGKGMDAELLSKVTDPFTTSRTTRKVGLGIPLLKEAAEACNGSLRLDSQPGKGTEINISFQLSHIDRMPMGDLTTTLLCLIPQNPLIDFIFRYQVNENIYHVDTRVIKRELQDVPISDPVVIKYLRESISEGITGLYQ